MLRRRVYVRDKSLIREKEIEQDRLTPTNGIPSEGTGSYLPTDTF
jgi:hypothetical protein